MIFHRSMFGTWWIIDDIKILFKKPDNRVTERYHHDRVFITQGNYRESESESEIEEEKIVEITIKEMPTISNINKYPIFCRRFRYILDEYSIFFCCVYF